jgi:hypothetical protein
METINKIYIVTDGDYSDYHIVKCFLNKKDADLYAEELECKVEEHDLFNTKIETRQYWETRLHHDGKIYYNARENIIIKNAFEEIEANIRSDIDLYDYFWNKENFDDYKRRFSNCSKEFLDQQTIAKISSYISEEHCMKLAVETYQKWLRRDL